MKYSEARSLALHPSADIRATTPYRVKVKIADLAAIFPADVVGAIRCFGISSHRELRIALFAEGQSGDRFFCTPDSIAAYKAVRNGRVAVKGIGPTPSIINGIGMRLAIR